MTLKSGLVHPSRYTNDYLLRVRANNYFLSKFNFVRSNAAFYAIRERAAIVLGFRNYDLACKEFELPVVEYYNRCIEEDRKEEELLQKKHEAYERDRCKRENNSRTLLEALTDRPDMDKLTQDYVDGLNWGEREQFYAIRRGLLGMIFGY